MQSFEVNMLTTTHRGTNMIANIQATQTTMETAMAMAKNQPQTMTTYQNLN